MLSAKIKEQNLSKYKKTAPLYFLKAIHVHQIKSVYFYFYAKFFVAKFKMKLNTLVTKYTDTLSFNFADTINLSGA